MVDIATLKIVVDTTDYARAEKESKQFADSVGKTEETIVKKKKLATDALSKELDIQHAGVRANLKNNLSATDAAYQAEQRLLESSRKQQAATEKAASEASINLLKKETAAFTSEIDSQNASLRSSLKTRLSESNAAYQADLKNSKDVAKTKVAEDKIANAQILSDQKTADAQAIASHAAVAEKWIYDNKSMIASEKMLAAERKASSNLAQIAGRGQALKSLVGGTDEQINQRAANTSFYAQLEKEQKASMKSSSDLMAFQARLDSQRNSELGKAHSEAIAMENKRNAAIRQNAASLLAFQTAMDRQRNSELNKSHSEAIAMERKRNADIARAAKESAIAVAGMDMAARRAAESKGILAKYSHQLQRTLLDLTPIISGVGLLTLAHGAIQATDKYTKLTSQLKIATNSTAEYGQALAEVKRISSAAQADITAITSLYQRLSLATQASGVSQSEIAMITETVALGLKANGASARESASAMLQLSQSFGSGRMAGEEFNSMAEAAPNVLRALAKSMGVPYGMLKTLASETKITTAVMVKAFTDPALLETFRAQAASMRTITGSWVELTNALVLYVGEGSKSSGVTKVLSGALSFLADNVKTIGDGILFIASAMAIQLSASILRAAADLILLEGAATKAMVKLTALSATTKGGLIGLALFAAYEVADYMGLIDRIFAGTEERVRKLRADILSVREIESQIGAKKSGKNDNFNVVPGLAEDAAAAYFKSIGGAVKDFRDYVKSDSFIFSKDFLSKEQENAAKAKELYATLNREIDKLWNMKGISTENRIKAEIQLRETYIERLAELNKKETTTAGKAAEAAAKEVAASQAKIAVMQVEMDGTVKLTDSQKKLIELGYEYVNGVGDMTAATYAKSAANLAGVAVLELQKAATDDATKAEEALQKQLADGRKYYEDYWAEVATSTEKLIEQAKQTEWETSLIGKSKDVIAAMTKERENATLVMAEENLQAMIRNEDILPKEIELQLMLIDALQRKKAAAEGKATATAVAEDVAAQTKAYEDQWKMIDGFAHTAFDNIFDKGKNVFKEIGNAIKKYVLDALYKMTIQKWIIPIAVASSGISGTAAGATAMSGVSGASDLFGLASIGSSIAGFGQAVATGFSLSASAASTAAAAYSSAGMAATSFGLQLGNMAAAIPGWGWAIAGGLALAGLLSGNGGTPTSSTGDASINFDASGTMTGRNVMGNYEALATDAADTFVKKMNEGYLDAAKSLGMTAMGTTFAFAANTGKDGKAPMFGIGGGVVGGTYYDSAETATSDAAVALELSRVYFQALEDSITESTEYLRSAFELVGDIGAASQAEIDAAMGFATALYQTRTALTETRSPLEQLTDSVNTGMADLGTSAETFKTDFVNAIDTGALTPALLNDWIAIGNGLDQMAQASAQAAEQLQQSLQSFYQTSNSGVTLGNLQSNFDYALANLQSSGATWIDNVDTLMSMTDTDFANYTSEQQTLINNARKANQEYSQAVQSANEATNTATESATQYTSAVDDMSAALAELAAINLSWQQRKDVLTGVSTQREIDLTNALNGAHESTAVLINEVFGLEDAATAAADALALAKTNLGIQQQIDVLTGAQTQRQVDLANALEGADDSTASLINQLFELQDAATAAADAAQKLADIESLRNSIASAYQSFVDKANSTAAAVVSAQEAITDGYLAAQDKVASAQEAITSINEQAAKEMKNFADNIREFVNTIRTTDLGGLNKSAQFSALMAEFAITTAQAKAGDTTALGDITGQAQALLDVKQVTATSAFEYARFAGQIAGTLDEVATLADGKAGPLAEAVDPMTKAIDDLAFAQDDLIKWERAVAVSGASTEKALVDYAADWREADEANQIAQEELIEATLATQGIDMQQLTELQKLNELVAQYLAASGVQVNTTTSQVQSLINQQVAAAQAAGITADNYNPNAVTSVTSQLESSIVTLYQDLLGRGADEAGLSAWASSGLSLSAIESQIAASAEAQARAISVDAQNTMIEAVNAALGTTTNIRAYADGSNYIGYDQLAMLHQGETITPKPYVDKERAARDETNKLLARLQEEVSNLRAENKAGQVAIARNTNRSAKVLEQFDGDGLPAERVI